MARFASFSPFNTTGTPGARGLTLDALMKRQADLAKNATQLPEAQDMRSPWQGAAYLANVLGDKISQGRAANDITATRDALAKVTSGIDYDAGATNQQINEIAQYNPELAEKLMQQRMDRAKEQRGYTQQREMQDAGFTHADTSREDQQTFQGGQQEDQQQSTIDAATASDERKKQEEIRKAEAGAKHIVSGDEAAKLGGDPGRQYTVSADGTTLTDITPTPTTEYRPMTPDEMKAYNLDPSKSWRFNIKEKKPEPVGSEVQQQLIPSEVGAKLGLADEFLRNYDSIVASATSGDLTGPIDTLSARYGRGDGADAYGKIKQGTEGLVRLMTGAGMNEQEARDRVAQYEPSYTDNAASVLGKLQRLKNAIDAVRTGATFGRNAPPAPGGGGGGGGSSVDDALNQYGDR